LKPSRVKGDCFPKMNKKGGKQKSTQKNGLEGTPWQDGPRKIGHSIPDGGMPHYQSEPFGRTKRMHHCPGQKKRGREESLRHLVSLKTHKNKKKRKGRGTKIYRLTKTAVMGGAKERI